MPGVRCRFNIIVLDKFAIPGKPVMHTEVLDEGRLGTRRLMRQICSRWKMESLMWRRSFNLYRPSWWYHTVPAFVLSLANTTLISGFTWDVRQTCWYNCRSAVIGIGDGSIASSADLQVVFVDQKSYAYSAYVMEANQMTVSTGRRTWLLWSLKYWSLVQQAWRNFFKIFLKV